MLEAVKSEGDECTRGTDCRPLTQGSSVAVHTHPQVHSGRRRSIESSLPPQANSAILPWNVGRKMTAIQQRWGARFAALEPELGLPEICIRLAQPYSAVQRWAAFFGYAIRDGRGH